LPNRSAFSHLGFRVFGLAAFAFGLIGLVYRDFASVWQPVPPEFPHRVLFAVIAALLFLLAGLAMQWPLATRPAVAALGMLYFLLSLLWLRRVIAFPGMIGTWSGYGEQVSLITAAIVLWVDLSPQKPASASLVVRLCRILFGLCFIALGVAHFAALQFTASMVPAWIPPTQRFWAAATGVFHLMAGASIITGVLDLLAARLLTAMIVGFGILVWAPQLFKDAHNHMNWCGNAMNLAIAGAAWIMADSMREARAQKT
jgi:uncharacterized membrane protein YphA (DoxX/SURF4 family)